MQGQDAHERSHLLPMKNNRKLSRLIDDEASSMISSHVTIEEQKLADSAIGERLPYNDYTTVDFLHDLVRRMISTYTTFLDARFRSRTPIDSVIYIIAVD